MKLNPFCMSCAIQREEKKLRTLTGEDNEKKVEYLKQVMALIASSGSEACSPSLNVDIKKIYARYFGLEEDYTEIKHEFNQLMLNLEASLEKTIRASADPLESALLFARIGNYIDYGALANVSKKQMLSLISAENKEPLDPAEYANLKSDLSKASSLVYLTDNCGEIVLDKLAIQILKEQYPNLDITVIVRGFPAINDATMEDAKEVGLTSLVNVIGNGSDVPGTWLPGITEEAKNLLYNADVIIAKGQGNFETLNDCGLNIYYLFLCKCDWFVKLFHTAPLTGMLVNERRVNPDRK